MKFFTHSHTTTHTPRVYTAYEHIDPIVNRSRTKMLCSKVFVCRATHKYTLTTAAARRKPFTALSRALIKPHSHARTLLRVCFVFIRECSCRCVQTIPYTHYTHAYTRNTLGHRSHVQVRSHVCYENKMARSMYTCMFNSEPKTVYEMHNAYKWHSVRHLVKVDHTQQHATL